MGSIRLAAIFITIIMAACVDLTCTEIFTSSLKVHRMVLEEEKLLEELKRYIDVQYARLKYFSNFYIDRLHDVSLRRNSDLDLSHPNAVYQVIKRFASVYSPILDEKLDNFRAVLQSSRETFVADGSDVRGAKLSLLRLQSIYNMAAMDMIRGDYLGNQGPQLQPVDAFEIGQAAFTMGKLNQSLDWLNTSLTLLLAGRAHKVEMTEPGPTIGAVMGLMGRVHLMTGSPDLATKLFNEAKILDPNKGDVIALEKELNQTKPRYEPESPPDYFANFSRLCSLKKATYPAESKYFIGSGGMAFNAVEPNSPRAFCRYREALLPYYRFREEILSVAPFASVIYNVITDHEGDHMKNFVRNRLKRGQVGGDKSVVSDIRTSDTAWIYDEDSPLAASVARRVEYVTGLDTKQRGPAVPSSGEAFQVVNYGLGGHYAVHMDPFAHPSNNTALANSGDRIATFLIYLSDVERGGATVFTKAGVSVAPVKNMALFWYNFTPANQIDNQTYHAGCPVMIGQKWIVNKWIWTYGNTFRRRCGLTPDATQLDIEPDMRARYKSRT